MNNNPKGTKNPKKPLIFYYAVMLLVLMMLWHFRKDRWSLGNWLLDCWRTICVLSWQTGMRAIKAVGKRAVSGNAF